MRVFFVGVLIIMGLLFGVHVRAPDFGKLPYSVLLKGYYIRAPLRSPFVKDPEGPREIPIFPGKEQLRPSKRIPACLLNSLPLFLA